MNTHTYNEVTLIEQNEKTRVEAKKVVRNKTKAERILIICNQDISDEVKLEEIERELMK